MLFNSISFAIFLPIVFALYWILRKNFKLQNILLLVASYYFYSCWDWRFVFLLGFSTLLDYFSGLKIEQAPNQKIKNIWLTISIGINLGFLGFFKYYNFFCRFFRRIAQRFWSTGASVDIANYLAGRNFVLYFSWTFLYYRYL